jgi:Ca2+-binding RTX toxin-like protein
MVVVLLGGPLGIINPRSSAARPGDIALASTSAAALKGNDHSYTPSLSRDGSLVAFSSWASNLHPADAVRLPDVYVKNLETGDVELASTSDSGVKDNRGSYSPSLSADGQIVAFQSTGTNLDPADTEFKWDIYVKDLSTGNLTLASTSTSGVKGNDSSFLPSISADGTRVAFTSWARNLDNADTNNVPDVYVKDLTTGDLILASTSDNGVIGNQGVGFPVSLSADGTAVAYQSTSTNLDPNDTNGATDVFVKNLLTGELTLASTTDSNAPANNVSYQPSLSANGQVVAFMSAASNLDPADTDRNPDVYVKNLSTGEVTLASASDFGVRHNGRLHESAGPPLPPALSDDGTRVAFQTTATNLDSNDSGVEYDVYVKDLLTEDVYLASSSVVGRGGNGWSWAPDISGDGHKVAFESLSTNLIPSDTDGLSDIYVKEVPSRPRCEGEAVTIFGTARSETLTGTDGADVIWAGPGSDTIDGRSGNDVLCGGSGADTVRGREGNDTVPGDPGNDLLIGGSGIDCLTYENRTTSTVINSLDNVSGHDANGDGEIDRTDEQDVQFDFECLLTGSANDTLVGSDSFSETFVPGDGDDDITGQPGQDRIDWSSSSAPMIIDPGFGTAVGQGSDDFVGVTKYIGSPFDDTLLWDGSTDLFLARAGIDTVDATGNQADVSINLDILDGVPVAGEDAPRDSIENLLGGVGDDSLRGNSLGNLIDGNGGNEHEILGRGSDDTLLGQDGNDLNIIGGDGVDSADGGDGTDSCDAETQIACELPISP